MKLRATTLLALVLVACSAPALPLPSPTPAGPTSEGVPSVSETDTPATPLQTPTDAEPALTDTSPAELAPSATLPPPPTSTDAPTEDPFPGLGFPAAISGGGEGSMYPGQDISVFASTGRVQFLNVYANW